jgi:hypothetical protein
MSTSAAVPDVRSQWGLPAPRGVLTDKTGADVGPRAQAALNETRERHYR